MNKYKFCRTTRELIICLLEHEEHILNIETQFGRAPEYPGLVFIVTWFEKKEEK